MAKFPPPVKLAKEPHLRFPFPSDFRDWNQAISYQPFTPCLPTKNIYIFVFYIPISYFRWIFQLPNKVMSTFTSTLPDDLLTLLGEKARKIAMPKNKLIENALRLYLEHLERAEYIKSYRQAATDKDILQIAEEGMADYLRQLKE